MPAAQREKTNSRRIAIGRDLVKHQLGGEVGRNKIIEAVYDEGSQCRIKRQRGAQVGKNFGAGAAAMAEVPAIGNITVENDIARVCNRPRKPFEREARDRCAEWRASFRVLDRPSPDRARRDRG